MTIQAARPGDQRSAVRLGDPLPFRSLIDEAARLVRRHFKPLYLGFAPPLVVMQVLTALFQVLLFQSVDAGADAEPDFAFVGLIGVFGCLLVPALLLVYGASLGALTGGVLDTIEGRPIAMGRHWRFMLRPRPLGTLLLVALVGLVGLLFCVLPGIYLFLVFSFVLQVMVAERWYGPTALGRSRRLAHYNPQRRISSSPITKILVIGLITYVLSSAVSLLLQLPLTILQQVMMLRDAAVAESSDVLFSPWMWLSVPTALFTGLGQAAVLLYQYSALSLLYTDVRRRKEGYDLSEAIAELERASSPRPPASEPGAEPA